MVKLILTIDDVLLKDSLNDTTKHQTTFKEMTIKLWQDFLKNHLNDDFKINSK